MKIKANVLLFWTLVLSAAVAVIAAACQYIAFLTEFDYSLRLFENDTFYEHFCNMLMLLGAIFALAATLALRFPHRTDVPAAKNSGIAFTVISVAVAAAMVYTFAMDIPEILAIRFPLSLNPGKITVFSYTIRILRVLFAALSAAYFFSLPSNASRGKSIAKYLSLTPTAWCLMTVLSVYFDRTEPLADPHKTYYTVLVILLMLFFSAESGILAERRCSSRLIFSGIASVACGGAVVLAFLMMLIRKPDESSSFSTQLTVAASALWVFVIVRMVSYVSALSKAESIDESTAAPQASDEPSEDNGNN